MKKVILSIVLVSTTFVFAQKKEINAAYKAVESNDMATANAQIASAEKIMGNKTYLLDPETLEQYYYSKGVSLIKSGKTSDGAQYLAKINDLGKSKIYAGKDAEKNKVYYVGKAAADASGLKDLKEQTYVPTTTEKLGNIINPILKDTNKQALDLYNAKKYSEAAPKFMELYNLLKAAGQDNKLYEYYAGITYNLAGDKTNAIKIYTDLINSGYTGVETTYSAKNKKTGEVELMNKGQWELLKKSTDYTDFKTESSKSVEQELYESDADLLIRNGQYDEALALIDKGLKKFPKDTKLTDLQGNAYFKSGKTDQFVESQKKALEKNPQDKTAWYNLGVIASKDPAKYNDAITDFSKALAIDPNYVLALNGMSNVYLTKSDALVEKIKAAQKVQKTDELNKLLKERRDILMVAEPFLTRWYLLDPTNADLLSTLKNVYKATGNDVKAKELEAKEKTLKAAN